MMTLPEKIDSKFRYVLLAAQRAEQMMRGAASKLDKPTKPTTAAMEEILTELVEWDYGQPEVTAEVAAAEGEAAEGEDAGA
ncbi:MAG: DNA-directed RNA polymerase subunit omega [Acidobacteriota bacterium]